MRSIKSVIGVLAAGLTGALLTTKKDDSKTLVLLDNWATVETHSIMFDYIKD